MLGCTNAPTAIAVVTPAMAAGLKDKLVGMADAARLIDDAEMRVTIQQRVAALACHNQSETRPVFGTALRL